MRRKGISSHKKLQLAERREMAWQLHKKGEGFRRIGEMLGYSKSSAQRDVQHVLDEVITRTVQDAAEQRAKDASRVEDVITAWYPMAAGIGGIYEDDFDGLAITRGTPDKDAAEVFLKAVDQKGKILGYQRQEVALTTPAPLNVTADLSGLDEESLDAIIRNLSAASRAGGD